MTVTIFVLTGSSGSQWTSWISRSSRNEGKVKQWTLILNQSIILVIIFFYRDNLVLLESAAHRVHKDREERLVTWEDLAHWVSQ